MQRGFWPSALRARDVLYRVILGCLAVGLTFLFVDRWSSHLKSLDQTQALLQEVAVPTGYEWQGVIEGVAAATRATANLQLAVAVLVTLAAYALCLYVASLEEVLVRSGVVAGRASDWPSHARRLVNRSYARLFAGWFAALAFIVLLDRYYDRATDHLLSTAATSSFELNVTQSSLTHLFRTTGDWMWLGPIVLLMFLAFMHLCRMVALLRAHAQVETEQEPTAQHPE